MSENKMMEFIEILKTNPDHAYDFICNEAWNFSKDELKDIVKELLYGFYKARENHFITKTEELEIFESISEELEEFYEEK